MDVQAQEYLIYGILATGGVVAAHQFYRAVRSIVDDKRKARSEFNLLRNFVQPTAEFYVKLLRVRDRLWSTKEADTLLQDVQARLSEPIKREIIKSLDEMAVGPATRLEDLSATYRQSYRSPAAFDN